MYKPTHAYPIHLALEVVGQTRLNCRGQNRSCRLRRRDILRCQLLVGMCKINLKLRNFGLQVGNNLGDVNLLLLRHSWYTSFDKDNWGYQRHTHTHNHRKHRYNSID